MSQFYRTAVDFAPDEGKFMRGIFDWQMPDKMFLVLSLSKDARSHCDE